MIAYNKEELVVKTFVDNFLVNLSFIFTFFLIFSFKSL